MEGSQVGDSYTIRIQGQLAPRWSEWFEGLTIMHTESGETILSGPVVDQAALHGLLAKVRDLNLTLVSVTRLELEHPIGEVEEKEWISKKAEELR